MEIKVEPLSQRAMSSFALSIGTALAFESLFKGNLPVYDPDRVIPEHIDARKYDEVWINLSTLVRNIHSSVPSKEQAEMMGVDLYVTLESEVEILSSLINEGTNASTTAVFYITDDSKLPVKHPNARIRLDTTDRMRAYTALKDVVLSEFVKRNRDKKWLKEFKEEIFPEVSNRVLILTHDSYDLLSHSRFNTLHLLESHTGLLKKKAMWYTKYIQGKELMRIPFNACFMQVFGDSLHFHPFPIRDRREIMELADTRKWTALTTKERLIYSFNEFKNVELRQKLLVMLNE